MEIVVGLAPNSSWYMILTTDLYICMCNKILLSIAVAAVVVDAALVPLHIRNDNVTFLHAHKSAKNGVSSSNINNRNTAGTALENEKNKRIQLKVNKNRGFCKITFEHFI